MSSSELLTSGRPWLRIDGERADRLETDLLRLEVRADASGLARLEACFLNWDSPARGEAVDYVHFDRTAIDFGKRIAIAFTVEGREETVFEGLVTAMGAAYPELRPPEFTLLAEDALLQLQMRVRTRLSEAMTDSDIAKRVAMEANLEASIGGDGACHRQLLQVNQDDLSALRERTGDALIQMREGRLNITAVKDETEPPLALSRENQLIRFQVLADLACQRGEVRVHGWDVQAKAGIHGRAGTEAIRPEAGMGRLGPDVVREVFPEAALDLHQEAPSTVEEARHRADVEMRRRARRFVRGAGVTRGTPTLRVGSRVDLVDLGPWFAGVYVLTAVTHRFDAEQGYQTEFEAQRPELGDPS
jgi:hypothetical protein